MTKFIPNYKPPKSAKEKLTELHLSRDKMSKCFSKKERDVYYVKKEDLDENE